MKPIVMYFDVVSPYAYLAFERVPEALVGVSHAVEYRPVLFAGLLRHWGQKGPAEIEPKRAWTFRQVAWAAHVQGTPIDTPAEHPFNPLNLLRLALACTPPGGTPNRRTVEAVMRHAWRGGADANAPARLQALARQLAPLRDPAGEDVKAELRANTQDALSRGIFGVPTFEVDGRQFWGLDALSMLRAYLLGDSWFDGPQWNEAGKPRPGVRRAE